jgi:hypothetical protein
LRFSFGTLVTDHIQYAAMRASFEARGFRGDDCEYLIVDNSAGNVADAYAGCRDLLNRAKGTFVILCHQDVVAIDDRAKLEACLAELDAIDPTWAVAGNAGGTVDRLFIRISDRSGSDQNAGPFPAKVTSLDENFFVVKRDAGVSFSRDMRGFHLYASDICLNADILGYSAYVIAFHLRHDGAGAMGRDFDACKSAFQAKWSRALRARRLRTTCTTVDIEPCDRGRSLLTGMRRKDQLLKAKHRLKLLLMSVARPLHFRLFR